MSKIKTFLAGGFIPALLFLGAFVWTACAKENSTAGRMTASIQEGKNLDDEEITDAVYMELLLDKGVASHLIDIETKEGIVTLSGTVDNILAKERAERITETIVGVRSIINLIRVDPIERKDKEVKEDIERALLLDPATDSYELEVNVDDGKVILTGSVESWAEKQLAEYVAKGVKGVKEVENNIDINYEGDRIYSEIKAEVERQLEINPLVDAGLIDVKVEDGTVFLSGIVGSVMEKTRAYNDAWVAGVEDVNDSGLEVEYWAKDEDKREIMPIKTDQEVEKAVKDTFLYDPRVFSFDVNVDADNGLVTLTGEVDNLKAKKAAAQDARNTTGVWSVDNRIIVRPMTPPSDEEIEGNVKDALLWNPVVERFELTVFVRNKKVYLYGRVDSAYEKIAAEDAVSRINGVVAVENNIDVVDERTWKSDAEIKTDIEQQFTWSIFVDAEDIDVSVDNGIATLEGEVDSITELDAALKDAFDGGARRVVNRLSIEDYPDYYPDLFFRDYTWPYWPLWLNWPPRQRY